MAFATLPLVLALVLPLQGIDTTTSQFPQTLAAMRVHYRPLLIFSPRESHQTDEQRQLLLSHRAELLDRNVMLVLFFRKYAGGWDSAIETNLLQEEAALRHRFKVGPDEFTVILLGKDGGEKFRSHKPITVEQLKRTIDAMPMRQQEMHTRPAP